MIEAIAIVDRGSLVIEAAPPTAQRFGPDTPTYRSITTTSHSASPPSLGATAGPWYITAGGPAIWHRQHASLPSWRWVPTDPEDITVGELLESRIDGDGVWEQTRAGWHVSAAAALAVLDLFGAVPDTVTIYWINERANNADFSGTITIDAEGPVSITLSPSGYAEPVTIEWGGPADFDLDGDADMFDFLAFQTAFDDGDTRADYDRDGGLTFFDFHAYADWME